MIKQTPKCHPRKRFNTVESARAACARIATTQKVQRYPEPCRYCNGWHLSEKQ